MDQVIIRRLKMDAVIGVYDWERSIRQPLEMDLDMEWDNRPAAASDDLALALDYDTLSRTVREYVSSSSFGLIETLAEETAALVMARFGVLKLTLTVYKPGAVAEADTVGVRITRSSAGEQSHD